LCVCSGFGSAGLPVSVQIVGKPFQDAMVLRVGDAFEKATDSRGKRPTLVA
jgi:aspartyl-tRNA(Asn)/glutamyl-tRNA(Gln) amidotransferase subunit A